MTAREPDDFRQLLVGTIDSDEYVRRLTDRVRQRQRDETAPPRASADSGQVAQPVEGRTQAAPPRLRVRCPECEGWDATKINCPHGCGVRMEAR